MSNVIQFKSRAQLEEERGMEEVWDIMAPILHEQNEDYLRSLEEVSHED